MAATARDPSTSVPPTSESPDPVAWMGWLAVAEALVLGGRFDEAMSLLSDDRTLPAMSALDGMTRGLLRGLLLTLTGRPVDARPFLESARASAGSVRARPGEQAATAVLAEIEARVGDPDAAATLLDDVGTTSPDSVAGVLALRARAALDEEGAAADLQTAAEQLAAPGLLAGMT